MSLATPEKIRTLQAKLYQKAKAEPAFRFYLLYDKICRDDILDHAYALAKANKGAPGVDGEDFAAIDAAGRQEWLVRLREELRTHAYRPQPVRRVMIPKPGGGERPLGIPTIRDRVAQTAAKLVLEPIIEADLSACAYGYRPERSAGDAIQEVQALLWQGYTDVVDGDLSKYFDRIPHPELMQCFARRISDRHVLHLLKMWLKAPVEERDDDGNRHVTGGQSSDRGTPQGGVISPLAANLYMNRFLKYWDRCECGSAFRAQVVNYADDFVILSRGFAVEALAWTDRVMDRLGLTLNPTKTCLRDARQERFDFLGYSFGPHYVRNTGRRYVGASPSKKSVQRLGDKVGTLLHPGNQGTWPEVRDQLNRLLRGWCGYFRHGNLNATDRAVERSVYEHVRNFLARRHKVPSRGTRRFSAAWVFGEGGVLRARHARPLRRPADCLR
jgi:RNA-directed DNA polymerase